MTATTSTRKATAKTATKAKTAPKTEAKTEAKTAPTPAPEVTAKTSNVAYRNVDGFADALKSFDGLAKGTMLKPYAQLLRHLAWKTPGGSVAWTKGTTAEVPATAESLGIKVGTAIPQAMDTVLFAAGEATTDAQEGALEVLRDIIQTHHTA